MKLHGNCASPGYIMGTAFVVNDELDTEEMMEYGNILVVKYSTPLFYEYFLKASAVVTEIGGITSHAASLARELNIPCIVSCENVLLNVKTGDIITVNANEGVVICKA